MQAFEAVARKHPDGPIFQSTYARALMEAGRAREALAIYRRAVARWPGDAMLYHELAVAARDAGDATEARRAEQAALALSPELPSARNGLGLLAADAGNHAEAAISFERASLADPTNASYLANLGNARRALGQLEGAAAAYRQALDRDATFADAANGLGVVLVQQKRAAEAVPFFERAVARDPAFAEAQLNLGIALQESGQRDARADAVSPRRRDAEGALARAGRRPRLASGIGASMNRRLVVLGLLAAALVSGAACRRQTPAAPASGDASQARNLLIVTIDTLRADRVGAYGYSTARTPALDGVARAGVRFDQAFAPSPITLTSHASLLTGRYPPGHGARHNGMAMTASVPTLATTLDAAGFATAAFVSAFPLDRRFGLPRGFDEYDDELARGADGRPLNERPGAETVRRARAWLDAHRSGRFFLWVHLFEPHAPYGDPAQAASRPAVARYDEEIAPPIAQPGSCSTRSATPQASTLVVITADHGEAFGEHGEIGHSIFVYDTTLRVPLVDERPRRADRPHDRCPGVAGRSRADGARAARRHRLRRRRRRSHRPDRRIRGACRPDALRRVVCAAPRFRVEPAPQRTRRDGGSTLPRRRPELYDVEQRSSRRRAISSRATRSARRSCRARVERYGPATRRPARSRAEAANRLALAGLSRRRAARVERRGPARPEGSHRSWPRASRWSPPARSAVRELIATLEAIVRDDPGNPQAHLRLGYAELERGRCAQAEPHFRTVMQAQMPSADAGLGLADCRMRANDLRGAGQALDAADRGGTGQPRRRSQSAVCWRWPRTTPRERFGCCSRALSRDPGLLEARFDLARALRAALAGGPRRSRKPRRCWRSCRPARRSARRSRASFRP